MTETKEEEKKEINKTPAHWATIQTIKCSLVKQTKENANVRRRDKM